MQKDLVMKQIDFNMHLPEKVLPGKLITSENIYWKEVRKNKIPFFDRGTIYSTIDGMVIFWHGTEAREAQSWLNKNKSIIEKK